MRLPPPISVSYSENYSKDSNPSPSAAKISPAVLFIIIILAVFFFVSGLLHLLVRILARHKSSSSISESDRYPEIPERDSYQRQLQQLFNLHDSGLDQAFIDELPMFIYKEIVGLNEHFDCAVCLCEFSEKDKLRLLPRCSHAFHINCIDTWLLSNSTCPLCRGSLISHDLTVENPLYFFDDSGEGDGGFGRLSSERPGSSEITSERWVFSVRLGKFRRGLGVEAEGAASSSYGLDVRRCYSMGSLQYVVSNSELQVSVCSRRIGDGFSSIDDHGEGKRIGLGSKAESFSVSKVWLWPKKGKLVNDSLCTVASTSAASSVHAERNRVL